MNKILDNYIVVDEMSGNKIFVSTKNKGLNNTLEDLGFEYTDTEFQMSKSILDDDAKLYIIYQLIELNALFQFYQGWSPSELMEYYKDKGVKFKSYNRLSFGIKSPNIEKFMI